MNIKNSYIVTSVLIAVLMIIAGYLLLSGGDAHRIWRSILINYLFFTPAAAGMVVWPAIVVASNGKWMRSLEKFCWTGLSFSLPSVIVLIILWTGSPHWAPWIDSQKPWLNNSFLFSRNIVLLLFFWIFAFIFLKNRDKKNKVVLASWLILIYAVVFSVAGFDFVMALEPKWYSMMAGGYFFISGLYIAAAAWAFLTVTMERSPDRDGLQDIGKLVITFCMLTSYLMYSQLLPIWYENLPDETVFLIPRMNLAWKDISYILLGVVYLGPVVFLLNRGLKRNPLFMGIASAVILTGMWIERWWLVSAVFEKQRVLFGWYEIIPVLAFTGLMSTGILLSVKYFRNHTVISKL